MIATLVHSTAWWLTIVHLVTVIFRRRGHVRRLAGFTALMWLTAAIGPAVWYVSGTQFLGRFAENKDSAGLGWIKSNFELNGRLVGESPAVFVAGFAIPEVPPDSPLKHYLDLGRHFTTSMPTARLIEAALIGCAAIIVIGLLPWSRWMGRRLDRAAQPRTGTSVIWLWCWAVLPIALLAMMSLPQDQPLSIFPHYMIYQPRYVAVCWPAWVLIMALALRNLPTWRRLPVRAMAIGFVAVVMAVSSLTNQLTYRLPPHAISGEMARAYFDPARAGSMLILESNATSVGHSNAYAVQTELGIRPRFDVEMLQRCDAGDSQSPTPVPNALPDNPGYWILRLRQAAQRPELQTVVMSDRLADTEWLTDANVQTALGAGWTLAAARSYRLDYEWHPYLSHGYRTRVWRRADLK